MLAGIKRANLVGLVLSQKCIGWRSEWGCIHAVEANGKAITIECIQHNATSLCTPKLRPDQQACEFESHEQNSFFKKSVTC